MIYLSLGSKHCDHFFIIFSLWCSTGSTCARIIFFFLILFFMWKAFLIIFWLHHRASNTLLIARLMFPKSHILCWLTMAIPEISYQRIRRCYNVSTFETFKPQQDYPNVSSTSTVLCIAINTIASITAL